MQKIIHDHNIVEYYLLNESGSLLMLNTFAQPFYCIIRSEAEINYHHQIAIDYISEANISNTIISALQHRSSLLYLGIGEFAEHIPPSQWEPYLYPASLFPDSTNYYYAFIEKPKEKPKIENPKIKKPKTRNRKAQKSKK